MYSHWLKIPIVVVPIPPLSKIVFEKYLKLLSDINSVGLEDLVQPSYETSKYTKSLFHQGHVYFRYITDFRKDLAYLSDIELHRQAVGVS
jgi:hypothetical protein